MAWVKIDDRFFLNPKVMQAGLEARALFISGLCFCAGELTDGFIATPAIRKLAVLADVEDIDGSSARLLNLGLWEAADGGVQVHDYLEYQPSRERVLATREARAEAGSRGGKQKASNLLEAGQSAATDNDVAKSYPVPVPTPVPVVNDSLQGGGGEPPARKRTAREIATATLREFGVSDRTVGQTLAVFEDSDMPRMALTAAKFAAHWQDNKRLKDRDRAWANWIKQEAKYQAEERANAPPERPLPDYVRPFPVIRLNGGSSHGEDR